ncbi:hypothetical protein B4135_3441 [Caldibacillus debilis]|uniref:Uncharacterized protein n=1 Tax=Caldibacillus debilis TaxID=301148 RepID=A0A150LEJ4_9BACI|nr:hypothetical protein B4135_3441 [Caldibacillus debilis]
MHRLGFVLIHPYVRRQADMPDCPERGKCDNLVKSQRRH